MNAASGTILLASSRNPSRVGIPVTFTATLSYPYAAPTGSVIFLADGQELGSAPISSANASFTTRNLARGPHSITARFDGGAGLAAASSDLAGGQVVENTPPVAGSGTTLAFALDGTGVTAATATATAGALDHLAAAEIWVRAGPGSADGATALRIGDPSAPALAITLQPGQTGLLVTVGSATIPVAAPLDGGAWHHLAVSANSGTVVVLVDGVAAATASATLDATGATAISLGEGLVGELDEVRLWSVERDVAAVTADLRRPISATAAGLLALWRLDEGTGSSAFDEGPSGINLSLAAPVGATLFVPSTAWRDRQVLEERALSPIDAGYDADGDALTLTVTAAPAHGTVTVNATTLQLSYTGAKSFVGQDRFTFQLDDGVAQSQYQIDVDVQPTVQCQVDADCAEGESCAGGVCTLPSKLIGRAAPVGCESADATPTALSVALLCLLFLRRRRFGNARRRT